MKHTNPLALKPVPGSESMRKTKSAQLDHAQNVLNVFWFVMRTFPHHQCPRFCGDFGINSLSSTSSVITITMNMSFLKIASTGMEGTERVHSRNCSVWTVDAFINIVIITSRLFV